MRTPEGIGATVVTVFSGTICLLTMAPSVSFWDCGEFIATAYTLGVPHPPGAPLYLLLGRLFSMLPIGTDVGFRVNLISPLASTVTVLLTYLIILRLLREINRHAQPAVRWCSSFGASIGALGLAFSDSFWFNSVESEVYALSMLFTAAVIYLILLWSERAAEAASAKYLLLIAYLLGLATGVHLLSLLAIPAIVLIVYFRRYSFSWPSLLAALGIGAALIFTIDPLLTKGLPTVMDRVGWWILPGLAVILVMGFVRGVRDSHSRLSLITASALLLILGYSTYATIFVRSRLNPRIDENDPERLPRLVSYLQRAQYGSESLVDQIFIRKADLWGYQVRDMYLRYLGWQFIGRNSAAGRQRETIQVEGLWGLPFLLGLVGLWFQGKRDPRRALAMLALFFMTGLAIILYLNQPLGQPRERDYSYVGSFFAFALWIGIGVFAVVDSALQQKRWRPFYIVAAVLLAVFAVPATMLAHNYHAHDRSGNHAAEDYAYNVLNTCAASALLFTNGDNDTFPLWYLQEVRGVRRDVSVICLSLLNTPWYIRQLRDREPRVPISIPDHQLDSLGLFPWPKPRPVEVPINDVAIRQYLSEAPSHVAIDSLRKQPHLIRVLLAPSYDGQFIRTQDVMIFDIISANQFRRPVYFGFNVPASARGGLQNYLCAEGMAYRLLPFAGVDMAPQTMHRHLLQVYRYRGVADPAIHLDANEAGLVRSYRHNLLALAKFYGERGRQAEAQEILKKFAEVFPESKWPSEAFEHSLNVGEIYWQASQPGELRRRLDEAPRRYLLRPVDQLRRAESYYERLHDSAAAESIARQLITDQPDFRDGHVWLAGFYQRENRTPVAVDLLRAWLGKHPQDQGAQQTLRELTNRRSTHGALE